MAWPSQFIARALGLVFPPNRRRRHGLRRGGEHCSDPSWAADYWSEHQNRFASGRCRSGAARAAGGPPCSKVRSARSPVLKRGWCRTGAILTRPPRPRQDAVLSPATRNGRDPLGDGWSEHGRAVRRQGPRHPSTPLLPQGRLTASAAMGPCVSATRRRRHGLPTAGGEHYSKFHSRALAWNGTSCTAKWQRGERRPTRPRLKRKQSDIQPSLLLTHRKPGAYNVNLPALTPELSMTIAFFGSIRDHRQL